MRVGNNKIKMIGFSVSSKDEISLDTVVSGQNISLVIDYISEEKNIKDIVCIINIKTLNGTAAF